MQTSRLGLRAGAIIGAASLATLAAAPALAADPDSQATAQSLQLTIAGQSAISQIVTATNDGSSESKNDASTIPTIAGVLPGNNALGAGVAPQDAGANADGTSWACAGIAGTGGGIVHTGNSSCDINGAPVTLNLGSLNLGTVALDPSAALTAALADNGGGALVDALNTLVSSLQTQAVAPLTKALASTPLGTLQLGGTVSALEASCTADPTAARGSAHVVDTQGGSTPTPIRATIDGQTVTLAQLPANPPPNTHVPTNLDTVTQTVIDAVKVQLNNMIDGQVTAIGGPVGSALQSVQDTLVTQLVAQLQPALKPLQDNVLDITLNKQTSSQGGRKIDVTAMDLQALPAAQQFTGGSSLVSGRIGEVTCGPNAGRAVSTPQGSANPAGDSNPDGNANASGENGSGSGVPTAVDAGLSGEHHSNTALYAGLGGLIAAGAAGTAFAYRRLGTK